MTDAAATDDHDETSVPGLWDSARWFMRWLVAVCGTPCDIVALAVLTRKERRGIFYWLRPVEAIVRRLLVAEAVRMAAHLPRGKPARCRPPRPPMRRIAFQNPEESTAWTVRFSVLGRTGKPSAPRRRLRRGRWQRPPAPGPCDNEFERMRRLHERLEAQARPAAPGRTFVIVPGPPPTAPAPPGPASAPLYSPWPTAERIETIRRVLEDPAPHVERLARRLARRRGGDKERIARACRPPPDRGKYSIRKFGETSIRHASEHALRALDAFDTS